MQGDTDGRGQRKFSPRRFRFDMQIGDKTQFKVPPLSGTRAMCRRKWLTKQWPRSALVNLLATSGRRAWVVMITWYGWMGTVRIAEYDSEHQHQVVLRYRSYSHSTLWFLSPDTISRSQTSGFITFGHLNAVTISNNTIKSCLFAKER